MHELPNKVVRLEQLEFGILEIFSIEFILSYIKFQLVTVLELKKA